MSDRSPMSTPKISTASEPAISSPASEDGRSPSSSPAGPTSGRCGPAPVPVSRSARQGNAAAGMTTGIYGRNSGASSPSAALQRCLESRLSVLLGVNGSPEYDLIWKRWDMPVGPPICRLRASARRTSDSGFGGWPSPTAWDQTDRGYAYRRGKEHPNDISLHLPGAARLAMGLDPKTREPEAARTFLRCRSLPRNRRCARSSLYELQPHGWPCW